MATITIRKEYEDGEILFGSDLDAIVEDIETFLNTTRINDDNIQNAGITASDKLVDATVTASKLASNAVTTTKLIDDAVTQAKIADAAVGTAQLIDSNVTLAKMADASVGTTELVDDAVTQAKIADAAVGTAQIIDANVTTAKLADSAVTAAKIADGTITRAKFTGGTSLYSYASTGNGTDTAYTIGSHTFTNRPFLMVIQPGSAITGGTKTSVTFSTSAATLLTSTTFDYPTGVVKYFASHTAGAYNIQVNTAGSGFVAYSLIIAIIEL